MSEENSRGRKNLKRMKALENIKKTVKIDFSFV